MTCSVHSVHTIEGLSAAKGDGTARQLNAMRQPYYGPLTRKATQMRNALTERAIEQVRSVRLPSFAAQAVAGTIRNKNGEVKDFLRDVLRTVGPRFVENGFQRAQGKAAGEEPTDQWFDEVARWLQSVQAGEEIRGITETARQDITSIIEQGIEDGDGTEEIARRLEENMEDINRQRGRVIARTETATAANKASSFGASKAPLDVRKTWLDSSDLRVRDSHEVVDGQTKRREEPYTWTNPESGEEVEAMYPADPGLPAAERIQCRCVETYEPA